MRFDGNIEFIGDQLFSFVVLPITTKTGLTATITSEIEGPSTVVAGKSAAEGTAIAKEKGFTLVVR